MPRPENAVLGGLPFASSDFRDFGAHGPRVRIDDLCAPSGRFVARVTAAVTTEDRRPGREEFFPAADTAFASVFAYPLRAARARQKNPLPQLVSPSMLLPRRPHHREPIPPRSLIRPRPTLRRMAARHLRLPCRLRDASPIGCAEEQPPPLVSNDLLLIMALGLSLIHI